MLPQKEEMSVLVVDLSKQPWTLRNESGTITGLKAVVPGDLLTDLENAKLVSLDSPHCEEEACKKFLCDTWIYTCTFSLPPNSTGRVALVCEGLDTLAAIYINGTLIGKSDNMFVRKVFELPGELFKLKEENVLEVSFRSVIEECRSHTDELASWEYAPKILNIRQRQWVRKAGCHFGWDFCPCLPVCGIWRPIYVVVHGVPHITTLVIIQKWELSKSVVLSVRGFLEFPTGKLSTDKLMHNATKRANVSIKVTESGGSVLSECVLSNVLLCENTVLGEIVLKNIPSSAMWWPRGYGSQHLCTVSVELSDPSTGSVFASASKRTGLRSIELSRGDKANGDERGFAFVVNSTPILVRGGSWVPTEIFHGRISPERQRELIRLCAAGGMNMVRVWGGGVYETDWFYDLCDEAGILVWQDMMFACACYPATPEFVESASEEVRQQVRRLASHPCIAIWCGNNENEEGMPFHCPWKDTYKEDYATLFNALVHVITEEDPGRPCVRTSPSRCVVDGQFDDLAKDIKDGDTHFWGLWHGLNPTDITQLYSVEPRFCSEFGFQSLPDFQQANLSLDEVLWRQRSGGGHEKLLLAVEQLMPHSGRNVRDLSLPSLGYLTQCFQALAVVAGIDHFRRLWPVCAGVLFWQINDIWNGPSWSCLNYAPPGCSSPLPKMLYYWAREAYAPVRVSAVLTGSGVSIWTSNALTKDVSGCIRVSVLRVVDGSVLTTLSFAVYAHPMTSERCADIQMEQLLVPKFSGGNSQREGNIGQYVVIATFDPGQEWVGDVPKNVCMLFFSVRDAATCVLGLEPCMRPCVKVAGVVLKGGKTFSVSVRGENGVCPFVWLGSLGGLLRYEDNGFTLVPGEVRDICGRLLDECDEMPVDELKKVITIKCLWGDVTL